MLAIQAVLLVAAEWRCRSLVGDCGVTPYQVSPDPDLASALRPGFATIYKGNRVRINSSGFRGPDFPNRTLGRGRILLVGDSYTFGSGVNEEDTLGAQLARELADRGIQTDVLNLGVPGYTAKNVARIVETHVGPLEPDLVLYVFFANDILEVPKAESIPSDAVIDKLAGFRMRSAAIEWTVAQLRDISYRFGFHLGNNSAEGIVSVFNDGGGARLSKALLRMQSACSAAGKPLAVLGYPHMSHTKLNPLRAADDLAFELVRELGLPMLDLLPAFGTKDNLSVYAVSAFDSHPNAEGHGLAAKYLAAQLVDRGLVQRP